MASFVNAADIAATAVEIERRGHAFYLAAQKHVTYQDDKDFFAFMAQEEKRHESIFASMLQRLGGLPLPTGSGEAEYLDYVQTLLDSHSLFLTQDLGVLLANPLHQAMSFEKDTILFFMAMRHLVPESEVQHIKACIEEEQRHLKMLAGRMKK